jgi:titin
VLELAVGLNDGTTYSFRIAALNAFGTGPSSAKTGLITVGTPTAPQPISDAPGDGSAMLSWIPPAQSNGGPVQGYVVTPFVGSVASAPRSFGSTDTSEVIGGLTNGVTYTFKIAAFNLYGTGPRSVKTTAVAVGTPTAPSLVAATPGNAQAVVSWSPPAFNNAAAVSGYVVTPYVGLSARAPRSFASALTTVVVSGLTNGTTYTFAVKAVNGFGAGPQSLRSAPVKVMATLTPRLRVGVATESRETSQGQRDAKSWTDRALLRAWMALRTRAFGQRS